MKLNWPVPYTPDPTTIPSGLKWGAPRTYRGADATHKGVDFAWDQSGMAVYSIAPGTVKYTGTVSPGGLTVYVTHVGTPYESRYYHLATGSIPSSIKKGATVAGGARVGQVGSTGITSSKPHLHFELLESGAHVDPLTVLGKGLGWPLLMISVISTLAYLYTLRS